MGFLFGCSFLFLFSCESTLAMQDSFHYKNIPCDILGHLSNDQCQMATFYVKTAHLYPAVLLAREHPQTPCYMPRFTQMAMRRVCLTPHQKFQLVKMKYLIPGGLIQNVHIYSNLCFLIPICYGVK